MTVYVAEIKGRGIAAFHANNGSDAERLVLDRSARKSPLSRAYTEARGRRPKARPPPANRFVSPSAK
jgi:hypothetical protein